MKITRRAFVSLLIAPAAQTASFPVAVLEAFENENGVVAVLVRHANPDERGRFAVWLQSNPRSSVRVHTQAGGQIAARMFRVRMCFGRGLLLFDQPVQIRERNLLRIEA